jgi:hypothetical protein
MTFKEYLTRCHLKMWSLGPPCYWDVCNARRGKRHWNYFNNCNKGCVSHSKQPKTTSGAHENEIKRSDPKKLVLFDLTIL